MFPGNTHTAEITLQGDVVMVNPYGIWIGLPLDTISWLLTVTVHIKHQSRSRVRGLRKGDEVCGERGLQFHRSFRNGTCSPH